MKKISVIIPVYKNKETLKETLEQIKRVKQAKFNHLGLEVVFVDDGSPDGSWQELQNLKNENPEIVKIVKLSRNFGQLNAMLAGYSLAKGDAVINISADLQDPIELMAEMVLRWEKGDEIVIAYRESREDSFGAKIFSRIAYFFAAYGNPKIPKGGFDYLLIGRRGVDIMNKFKGHHRFFQGDVLWLGFSTSFIPYVRKKRAMGKSGYTFAKKLKTFIDLLLDSSFLPIRVMSALGFITAAVGMIYAGLIVYSWFIPGCLPFQGWAPIMILILVLGGLIMVMLGIIGEYLWRIYDDIKSKPNFVVEEISVKKNDERI